MTFDPMMGAYFWGFMLLYGTLIYILSPAATTANSFFRVTDIAGRPTNKWALMMSIFISWIFAKSVNNAANLGAVYGMVGGLAYATIGCPFRSPES